MTDGKMTVSLAASTDPASSTPLIVECTPFHSETAVGRDSSIVRVAAERSFLKASRSLP